MSTLVQVPNETLKGTDKEGIPISSPATAANNPFGKFSSQTSYGYKTTTPDNFVPDPGPFKIDLNQLYPNTTELAKKWSNVTPNDIGGGGWLRSVARFEESEDDGSGRGSLAKTFTPLSDASGDINIVRTFPWTVSFKDRSDIPYIQLREHKVDGGQIQKQLSFYAQGVGSSVEDYFGTDASARGILEVYREIFPRYPTKFKYTFPYFSKAHYELTTPQWEQFDKISSAGGGLGSGMGQLFGKDIASIAGNVVGLAQNVAETALLYKYPVAGIADRPRIFTGHNDRTITIEFPLFNTLDPKDWERNKDFLYLFNSQNLFNKRNFITGLPPVWYEVWIPGQYYSIASSVTNIAVENLGNLRIMRVGKTEFIVPDAYQISISLTELAMPSKNQYQASRDGTAEMRVNASSIDELRMFQGQENTSTEQERTREINQNTPGQSNTNVREIQGGGCWVARAVYGETNPDWLMFRTWMLNDGPVWFRFIYCKFGESFAKFIKNKPLIKKAIKYWMDYIIKK